MVNIPEKIAVTLGAEISGMKVYLKDTRIRRYQFLILVYHGHRPVRFSVEQFQRMRFYARLNGLNEKVFRCGETAHTTARRKI